MVLGSLAKQCREGRADNPCFGLAESNSFGTGIWSRPGLGDDATS